MAVHRWLNNFTGGEWTPLLDGRTDLEKYDSACRTMENIRPLPYGGGKLRGGLQYIAAARYADKVSRVIAFNFSTGTRFVIELGDLYLRFFSNKVQVTSGGLPYTVVSPYTAAQVFDVHVKQINDVMYLCHPDVPTYKLSRVTDTNWTLEEVEWTYPPMREENTTACKLAIDTVSVGTGRTVTATGGTPFVAGHVGAYFEIRHLREGDAVELAINGTGGGAVSSAALTVKGDWSLVTTERWYGVLELERSTDGGSTWTTARKFKSSADRNVSASGTETEESQLRLTYTPTGDPYGASVWAGTAPTDFVKANAKLEVSEAYATGLVKVTGYTDTTHVTVEVLQALASTAATDTWSEGAWSAYRGYPAAVGLFEQRLIFAGNAEKPLRKWGSVTGDFENFEYGDDDDAAFAFDIASAESNPIRWIEAFQRILIGTGGGEHAASAGTSDEPLTPSNISVRDQSAYGSDRLQAIKANDAVVFLQRQGRKLREMSFDLQRDGYVAPDLTLLAEHVTDPGVVQLGFTRQPDPMLLAVTGEHLAVMTYDREQNVRAWARYTTEAGAGYIESVCSIYGDDADEIWCVVRRTVGGSDVRYIEVFAAETDNKVTARLLDSWKSGTISAAGDITGLDHLEGKTVRLVINGAQITEDDYVVTGGKITVAAEDVSIFGTYVVGLPYRGIIQPMKIEVPMANGPSAGRTRRVSEVTYRFKDTLGCKFGPDLANLEEFNFRDAAHPMDSSAPLFTGEITAKWPGGHDKTGNLYVVQERPYPFCLLGIAVVADYSAS